MAVRTARINTVSFSYSNVAKNGLVCKPGDVLTLVKGEGGQMFVDLATPDSLIWGICDDKKVFSDTNETKELDRVNYTPIAWDNTYKMEVSGEGTPKVGFFYTMTADQKIDLATESDSVGQFMVQDINDAYIEVRFVCNQGLAVAQYEDVRLESIRETNPGSVPFDGQYTFVLSNGTEIKGDFSALAWYLGDVTITGELTVEKGIKAKEDIETEGNIKANGDIEGNNITASGDIKGVSVESDTFVKGESAEFTNTLKAGDSTLGNIESESIKTTGNAEIGGTIETTGDISTQADIVAGGKLNISGDAEIGGNQSVTGNSEIGGNQNIKGDSKTEGNAEVLGNTTLRQEAVIEGNAHFKKDVDIDGDTNIDGSAHIGGSASVDHVLTVKEQLTLGADATAPQFILQTEKNKANGVAALNANGKLDDSVLPPLAIGQTFVVDSEANMLALTADTGDICVRTDISKTFVKLNDNNPSTLADWQQLQSSGEVISVNGKTGSVVLNADDIDDTTTQHKFVTAGQIESWNDKQNRLNYTPENVANKDKVTLVDSDEHYPSSKVVKELLDGKQNSLGYIAENVSNKDTAQLVDSADHYPSSHVVYDQLQTKQAKLENQVNIKSINNQSLLGQGNLTITADVEFFYEQTTQGASEYTLQHTPISNSSIMVFTDSGTALFPMVDYVLNGNIITFVNLGATESAIIRIAAQVANPNP